MVPHCGFDLHFRASNLRWQNRRILSWVALLGALKEYELILTEKNKHGEKSFSLGLL